MVLICHFGEERKEINRSAWCMMKYDCMHILDSLTLVLVNVIPFIAIYGKQTANHRSWESIIFILEHREDEFLLRTINSNFLKTWNSCSFLLHNCSKSTLLSFVAQVCVRFLSGVSFLELLGMGWKPYCDKESGASIGSFSVGFPVIDLAHWACTL